MSFSIEAPQDSTQHEMDVGLIRCEIFEDIELLECLFLPMEMHQYACLLITGHCRMRSQPAGLVIEMKSHFQFALFLKDLPMIRFM